MPDVPTPARMAVPAMLADFDRRLTAMERQQQRVITDPTGTTGDPSRGRATLVEGQLSAVGLTGYGEAVWNGTAWQKIPDMFAQLSAAMSPPGRIFGGEIRCTSPTPTLGTLVLGITGVVRAGAGVYTMTHATAPTGKMWFGAGNSADIGGANPPHTIIWRPVDATHTTLIVYDRLGGLVDGETVYFLGYG